MSTFNPEIENPGTQELRKFGLVSGSIVAVLFGLLLPWIFGFQWPRWPWIFAGVLGSWALIHPNSLFLVYKPWLKFGHIAGWINTRIILGILFYLVFLPAGMIMRLLGKDPMFRKLDKSTPSYRITSEPIARDHVERPY
jgi:hypothetical protein